MINLQNLDRRVIFLLVILSLSIPLVLGLSMKPARMKQAQTSFDLIDQLKFEPSDIAFIALDFGANTKAENLPQAEVLIEHLMRKRVPVALFSLYVLAEPFLISIPEKVSKRLMQENPGQVWEYGKDWVNLGYNPGGFLIVQAIPKSENLVELFKKDARGNNLSDIPAFKNVRTLKNIKLLGEVTGLLGMFDTYVQFFQSGEYRPLFVHGCTSITIPEAYIYVDSGQLNGLLEGIAGAAWYSRLLSQEFKGRGHDTSELINTGLGVAQLVIIALVILGNLSSFLARKRAA